jgi:L-ascorbate metabolism protein UlaG (beta-lactamase superfamily)
LGHDCFRVRGRDVTLVTDPFGAGFGSLPAGLQADIVTVSHDHPGHNHVEGVGGRPRALRGPGEYEIKGVLINGVATFHDTVSGKERGRNTVYVIEIDDLTLCHLGDLGHVLSAQQVDEIGNIDILLVPAGGEGTLSVAQAAEVISQLEPSMVIPMNYTLGTQGERQDGLEKFCHEMGVKEFTPQPRVTVTKSSLPTETQVVILGARSEGR